ncbi:MAG: sulfurtransferase TusA family protein [Methanolobus sp.]
MTETNIDVRGETCPVPLVECRKAIRKAQSGDEIVILGTHPASKKKYQWPVQPWELKL